VKIGQLQNPHAACEALARQLYPMNRALQPVRLNAKGICGYAASHRDERKEFPAGQRFYFRTPRCVATVTIVLVRAPRNCVNEAFRNGPGSEHLPFIAPKYSGHQNAAQIGGVGRLVLAREQITESFRGSFELSQQS
jgi:hypothetical protein